MRPASRNSPPGNPPETARSPGPGCRKSHAGPSPAPCGAHPWKSSLIPRGGRNSGTAPSPRARRQAARQSCSARQARRRHSSRKRKAEKSCGSPSGPKADRPESCPALKIPGSGKPVRPPRQGKGRTGPSAGEGYPRKSAPAHASLHGPGW